MTDPLEDYETPETKTQRLAFCRDHAMHIAMMIAENMAETSKYKDDEERCAAEVSLLLDNVTAYINKDIVAKVIAMAWDATQAMMKENAAPDAIETLLSRLQQKGSTVHVVSVSDEVEASPDLQELLERLGLDPALFPKKSSL